MKYKPTYDNEFGDMAHFYALEHSKEWRFHVIFGSRNVTQENYVITWLENNIKEDDYIFLNTSGFLKVLLKNEDDYIFLNTSGFLKVLLKNLEDINLLKLSFDNNIVNYNINDYQENTLYLPKI